MKLLKKITAKDVLGPVLAVVKAMEIDTMKEAYAVAGIATGYETGISTYGEWVRFIGDFQATNYVTGEICRAEKAHVPDVLQSAILSGIGELEGVVSSSEGGNITKYKLEQPIEFAFKVDITRNADKEDGAVSYEYITTPLTVMAENDSLSHLTNLLPAPGSVSTSTEAPPKKAAKKSGKKAGKK